MPPPSPPRFDGGYEMRHYILKVIGFFSTSDLQTWYGHALWGALFTLIFALLGAPLHGVTFTAGAFFLRELDTIGTHLLRRTLTYRKLVDSIGDFIFPLAGAFIVAVPWELLIG